MRYSLPKRAGGKPNLAFVLKACPRCLGDLILHRDPGGEYYACLQCGAEVEPRSRAAAASRRRSRARSAATSSG